MVNSHLAITTIATAIIPWQKKKQQEQEHTCSACKCAYTQLNAFAVFPLNAALLKTDFLDLLGPNNPAPQVQSVYFMSVQWTKLSWKIFFHLSYCFYPLADCCPAAWILFPPGQTYRTNNSSHMVEKERKAIDLGLLWCVCAEWVVCGRNPWHWILEHFFFLLACGDTCSEEPQSSLLWLTCWDPPNKQNKLLPSRLQLTPLTFPFSGPAELLCLWILRFSSKHAGNRAI